MHIRLIHIIHTFIDTHGSRVGRILIGLLFLASGVSALLHFKEFVAFTGTVLPLPTLFAVLAIILKIGGGLSLILRIHNRIGAYALLLFIIPATLLFHVKGALEGDQKEIISLLKNIAITGGLFLAAQAGTCPCGVCNISINREYLVIESPEPSQDDAA